MTKNITVIEIPDFESLEDLLNYYENIIFTTEEDLFTNEDVKLGFLAWKKSEFNQNKIPMRSVKNISIEILKKA